jgi:adenylylsulfate kinase
MAASVPVLLVTGPVGVGKSSVAAAAAHLLREAGVPHALVDLAGIGAAWPVPDDDPWNERLTHRNLACMWANFRNAGAGRLLLARVLEHRSLLRPIMEAVPGAAITVVRLRAPLAVVQTRIRHREAGDPGWFLQAAAHTAAVLERAGVEDHLVDCQDRAVLEVAQEVLRLAGWVDAGVEA